MCGGEIMKRCLAFVLGGGGARGALQLGALRALLCADIVPDLLVGTSIGAVNAVGLALWGPDLSALETLEWAYHEIWDYELMDPNVRRVALRAALDGPNREASARVADVLIASGITPDVRFDEARVRLAVVGANLDTGQPVIYGQDPSQSVMDGVLASIAVPPWFAPIEKDGEIIIDGGFVSNLPIEAAIALGATEIIALDLDDPRPAPGIHPPIDQFLDKLLFTVTQRQKRLELALAEARDVPVRCIELRGPHATPIWDFGNYRELIQTGYEIGCRNIAEWADLDQAPVSTPDDEARCFPASQSDTKG
jgi:NTE family protein